MLLTLLALAGVLFLLEETFTRLVRETWRSTRWVILPLAGTITAYQIPLSLFGYPTILDLVTTVLFGLAAGCVVLVYGVFRDAYWRPRAQRNPRHHQSVMERPSRRPVRPAAQTPSSAATVRAPLRTRP